MSSPNYLPGREEWLQRHREDMLEPELPMVDAHHHFYDRPGDAAVKAAGIWVD